ncbi:MAG: hypothetical protein II393_02160 [Cytophagales bacterium]|nr:hypothetical protein [Cytophagales bacterium]
MLSFSINITFSNLNEVSKTIDIIQEHIKTTYGGSSKINFRLKEIKSNIAYLNAFFCFVEVDRTQILNKELLYVDEITDFITSHGGSVDNVYNFTI